MEIIFAEYSGFCFGVKRAVEMVRSLIREGKKPIFILGNLIHNPTVVEELQKAGVQKISSLDEAENGWLVIRSHGATKETYEKACSRGLTIVDTTCPNVKYAQNIAKQLSEEKFRVMIVGDRGHAEVEGILSYTNGNGAIIQNVEESKSLLEKLSRETKIAVLCQTTIQIEKLNGIVGYLIGKFRQVNVYNTICDVSTNRQASTLKLAREVDLMLVVGGFESANTTRLAEISSGVEVETHHIESSEQINPEWFNKNMKIGLSAGASTPIELMEEVRNQLNNWLLAGKIRLPPE
ncbi:MAG: 4-hydroxy-3-methylbut-2-enyl diphosphate reductase [Candidatus Riflebacteria bacterium]|nr:4-hydroxy-3-methylbut-2-enyl diphosphate reductase [Candidatus Riflebacteria bacterium]